MYLPEFRIFLCQGISYFYNIINNLLRFLNLFTNRVLLQPITFECIKVSKKSDVLSLKRVQHYKILKQLELKYGNQKVSKCTYI